MVRAVRIMDRAHEMVRDALRFGVHRSFAITRSHYKNIDLVTMSQGFMPGYSKSELEDIEESVAPWRRTYLSRLKMRSSPRGGS